MIPPPKFASLIGSVTLAFVLAASIRPVNTAPVIRRQDAVAAPAGYISVAQPQMSEQDIYAVGTPPPTPMTEQDIYAVGNPSLPAADPESQLEQILKAAAQAALSTSNNTMNAVNHYDATPSTTLASPEQVSQVGTTESVQKMTGNPGEGGLFKQAAGVSTTGQGTDTYQKRDCSADGAVKEQGEERVGRDGSEAVGVGCAYAVERDWGGECCCAGGDGCCCSCR